MADPYTTALTQAQVAALLAGAGPSLTTSALEALRSAQQNDGDVTPAELSLLAIPSDS